MAAFVCVGLLSLFAGVGINGVRDQVDYGVGTGDAVASGKIIYDVPKLDWHAYASHKPLISPTLFRNDSVWFQCHCISHDINIPRYKRVDKRNT